MSDEWNELAAPPFYNPLHYSMSKPLVLSDTELVILTYTSSANALYKYSISEDKWIEWINYPKDFISDWHTASISDDKSKVFVLNEDGKVIVIDLKMETFKASANNFIKGKHCKSVIINNEQFNVFGLDWDGYGAHYIWNKPNLEKIYQFKEFKTHFARHYVGLLYSERDTIMIIPECIDKLYLYSIKDKKSKQLEFNSCAGTRRRDRIFAATTNSEYIIIINFNKFLQIYDVAQCTFIGCDIKAPKLKYEPKLYDFQSNTFDRERLKSTFNFIPICEKQGLKRVV